MAVYSVYDKKAEMFFSPMTFHNDAHACREMRRVYGDPKSSLNQYPEDYDLFLVGSWDDGSAALEGLVPPRMVAKGTALVPDRGNGEPYTVPIRPSVGVGGGSPT